MFKCIKNVFIDIFIQNGNYWEGPEGRRWFWGTSDIWNKINHGLLVYTSIAGKLRMFVKKGWILAEKISSKFICSFIKGEIVLIPKKNKKSYTIY